MGGVNFTGYPNFISSDVYLDRFDFITIGEDCVVSKKVTFLTHDYSLTTGLKAIGKKPETDIRIVDRITLERNVFVGLGVTLLPGTYIGENTIIGSGAVVKGKIPSNSVVVGNPAKVVCTIQEYANKKLAMMDKLNTEV